jgi:hypothetical protein
VKKVSDLLDLLHQASIFALLSMLVPVGVFGLAVSYLIWPTERKLALMRPVSLAAIFAAVCGLLSGWAMVLAHLAASEKKASEQIAMPAVYMGVAETLTLGFVCFGFLAAAWLLVAAGMLRRGRAIEPGVA